MQRRLMLEEQCSVFLGLLASLELFLRRMEFEEYWLIACQHAPFLDDKRQSEKRHKQE